MKSGRQKLNPGKTEVLLLGRGKCFEEFATFASSRKEDAWP